MARNKGTLTNIDNSNPADYPNGRIQDNTGAGNGTPVNEFVYGDIHEFFAKAMRLYGINFNALPDNENNGYQYLDAIIALASKNDFTLEMTSVSTVLRVQLKLGSLKNDETFIVRAAADKTTETTIEGALDSTVKNVTFVGGDFKAGEYLRLVNTATSVLLIRMVDAFNLDVVATEQGYLKAADTAETIAGILTNKGVTPAAFKAAFTDYVNGANSPTYLATALINGLYPKEHFDIVANLGAPDLKNRGFVAGIDVGALPVGTPLVVGGDIASAVVAGGIPTVTLYDITLNNPMDNTDYLVRMIPESNGTLTSDATAISFTFRPTTTTTFQIAVGESGGFTQNIKLHLEVVQL